MNIRLTRTRRSRVLSLFFVLSFFYQGRAQPQMYISTGVQNEGTTDSLPTTKEVPCVTLIAADGGPFFVSKVDSVSRGQSPCAPFAAVYISVMNEIERQLKTFEPGAAAFILKFEQAFAGYFLHACSSKHSGTLPVSSPWKNMLDNGNIHPLRLAIMGINTHVNADIWETMVVNFTPEEILRYRKPFLACQRSIARIYSPLFDAAASKSFYIRLMRVLTFGSVKKLGELILYKWRLTQEKLALLYFRDPERFCRKRARINQKKERLDRRLVSGFSLLLPRDP